MSIYLCGKARCPKRVGSSGSPSANKLGYSCTICGRNVVEKKSGLSLFAKLLILFLLTAIFTFLYLNQNELANFFSNRTSKSSNESNEFTKSLYEVTLNTNQMLIDKTKGDVNQKDVYRQAIENKKKIQALYANHMNQRQKKKIESTSSKSNTAVQVNLINDSGRIKLQSSELVKNKSYFEQNALNEISSIEDITNAVANFVVFNSNSFEATRENVMKVRSVIMKNISNEDEKQIKDKINTSLKKEANVDFIQNKIYPKSFTLK